MATTSTIDPKTTPDTNVVLEAVYEPVPNSTERATIPNQPPVQGGIENGDQNFVASKAQTPPRAAPTGVQSVEEMAEEASQKAKDVLGFHPADNAQGLIGEVNHHAPGHASMQFGNGELSMDPKSKFASGLQTHKEMDRAANLIIAKAKYEGWEYFTLTGTNKEMKDRLWLAAMKQGIKFKAAKDPDFEPGDTAWAEWTQFCEENNTQPHSTVLPEVQLVNLLDLKLPLGMKERRFNDQQYCAAFGKGPYQEGTPPAPAPVANTADNQADVRPGRNMDNQVDVTPGNDTIPVGKTPFAGLGEPPIMQSPFVQAAVDAILDPETLNKLKDLYQRMNKAITKPENKGNDLSTEPFIDAESRVVYDDDQLPAQTSKGALKSAQVPDNGEKLQPLLPAKSSMLTFDTVAEVVSDGGVSEFRARKQQADKAMRTLDGLTGTAVTDTGPQTQKQLKSAAPADQKALPPAAKAPG